MLEEVKLRREWPGTKSRVLNPSPDSFVLLREDSSWHLFDEPFVPERIFDYERFSLTVRDRISSVSRTPRVSLIVFVSEACNLRCDYCKVASMINAPEKIRTKPQAIAKTIIEASNRVNGPVDVIFYGGEPLLEYLAIQKICETVSAAQPNYQPRYTMTTNGTLLNSQIIEVLLRYEISVGVSIDGDAEVHDGARLSVVGRQTHQRVVRNYAQMKRAGVSCGPISVVTDPARFRDTFAYFNTEFGDRHVHLKPLEVIGTEDVGELRAYFDTFADQQLALLENNLVEFSASGTKRYETRTNGAISGVLYSHDPAMRSCRTSGQSTNASDYSYQCSIGNEIEGVEADGRRMPCPNVKGYRNRSSERIAQIANRGGYCDRCSYQRVCPSFCLAEMHEGYVDSFLEGAKTEPVDVLCSYNRRIVDGIFNLYRKKATELTHYAAAQ